jgi:hypothetical protein
MGKPLIYAEHKARVTFCRKCYTGLRAGTVIPGRFARVVTGVTIIIIIRRYVVKVLKNLFSWGNFRDALQFSEAKL